MSASVNLFAKFRAMIHWSGTPQNLFSKTFIRNAGTGNLKGVFHVGQNSANLLGKFEIRYGTKGLFGKFEVRQITHVNLFADFKVRHTGTPLGLFSKFLLRQWYQNLFAEAAIRHSSSGNLFGKFQVRHSGSSNVFGEFIVRHTATATRFAKFVVRHSSSNNLFAEARIRHVGTPQNLKAKLRITTEQYVVQGISAEAYIALTVIV